MLTIEFESSPTFGETRKNSDLDSIVRMKARLLATLRFLVVSFAKSFDGLGIDVSEAATYPTLPQLTAHAPLLLFNYSVSALVVRENKYFVNVPATFSEYLEKIMRFLLSVF